MVGLFNPRPASRYGEAERSALAFFDRANETFIFAMIANPEPDKVFAVFDRQCADREIHSRGPNLADLLELQRWMSRIPLQHFELLIG